MILHDDFRITRRAILFISLYIQLSCLDCTDIYCHYQLYFNIFDVLYVSVVKEKGSNQEKKEISIEEVFTDKHTFYQL
jgi:hypothetical protein